MKKTIKYYDDNAAKYDQRSYNSDDLNYPANLFRLEIAKNLLNKIPKGKVLDSGCGTGQLLCYLLENEYDCAGFDFSTKMIEKARNNIEKISEKKITLINTSMDDLSAFEDNSFDIVCCLGIFPYILPENEEKSYSEIARVIKKGGYLLTAEENELFDLFTFNKYSIRFFERNFLPLIKNVENEISADECKKYISNLIKYPNKPIKDDPDIDYHSTREYVFTKPENPITYPNKLLKYNFKHMDTYYYNFHAMPPLIRNNEKKFLDISKKLEINMSQDWRGMFIASTFLTISQFI